MADCSKLTAGLVGANCSKPAIVGNGPVVLFGNFNDVNKADSVVTNNVISSIAMLNATKFFKFEGLEDSIDANPSLKKGKYFSYWNHQLIIRVFIKTEAAKAFINALNTSRTIAIIQNKETGITSTTAGEPAVTTVTGCTKYEAYGWDAGLSLNDAKEIAGFTDGVVYELTFGSSDTSLETSLPKSVFVTDEDATDTLIAGLTA